MSTRPIVACVPMWIAEQMDPGKYPDNVPGSTYSPATCPQCGEAMWIGSRGKALVEAGAAECRCMLCLVRDPAFGDREMRSLGGG